MIELAEILLEPGPAPFWRMLKQVGVDATVSMLPRHFADWRAAASEQPWEYGPLVLHQHHIEEVGLRLEVIEDNPPMDRMRLGRPGREEELEHFCTLIRNMGALGIPVLCYNWMAVLTWLRTSVAAPGRGGALVTAYDHDVLANAPLTHVGEVHGDDLWTNFQWFLERVVPVAEEAGVKLALHPDDPPLSPIRGIDRIFSTVDAFQRAVELVPSEVNGITMCQGNFTLMTQDLPAVISQFGRQGKIHFIHFRDVVGTAAHFTETFHDEGKTDMLACVRAYRDAGVAAVMRTDHTPTLEGDVDIVPGYSQNARLFAIGYTRGLLEAVAKERA